MLEKSNLLDLDILDLVDCLLAAHEYIEESPCDPDITDDQAMAWINYNYYLEKLNLL